jgi:hypothetical protein
MTASAGDAIDRGPQPASTGACPIDQITFCLFGDADPAAQLTEVKPLRLPFSGPGRGERSQSFH